MNGLLNQQTKSFSINEFISLLATECLTWFDCKEFTGLMLFFTYIFKNKIKVEQHSSGGLSDH